MVAIKGGAGDGVGAPAGDGAGMVVGDGVGDPAGRGVGALAGVDGSNTWEAGGEGSGDLGRVVDPAVGPAD